MTSSLAESAQATYYNTKGAVVADVYMGNQDSQYFCAAFDSITGLATGFDAAFMAEEADAECGCTAALPLVRHGMFTLPPEQPFT